jgi:prolyl-tRNA synthetase
MRLSHLFTKTSKDAQSDASSKNADLLVRGGFIHKTMAGVYSYLPLGLIVLRHVEQIVREEMDRIGAQEILMSALSPKENWEKTNRWDRKVFDVLFHVPAANDTEYALNPTHEELVTPLARQYIHSYRDLPFAAYQIQTKFRNELRAKSGIMRGREFLMKDLYSFHATQEDLDQYYLQVQGAYDAVFERLGLSAQTYFTYAAGGTFSKYSHEYQIVLPSGEDIIYISVEAEKQGKRIAINREIYEAGVTVCPVTGGIEFREEKASEAANIFMLGTKFSSAFEVNFTAQDGSINPVIMGCYGIGISRLMGIIAEAMSDDKGLQWPLSVAPAAVHIVPVARSADDEAYKVAVEMESDLLKCGKTCILDDRFEASVGFKLADADLIGVPMRIVVSPKTLADDMCEVHDRRTGKTEIIKREDVEKML